MKVQKLDRELSEILRTIEGHEPILEGIVADIHKDYKFSAKNLCRYLLLRSFDLRKYHDNLSDLGVSALRTAEGYVLSNLQNVVKNLRLLQNIPFEQSSNVEIISYKKSKKLIKKHANQLFNKTQNGAFTEV